MICFAFPLEHEAASVLRELTEKESFTIDGLHCTLGKLGARQVLVALIGMGEAAAGDNTETIFQYFRLKALVLAGYGGALVPPLKVGQVVISSNYTSEAILGFLRLLSGFDFANFCTVEEIAGTVEKRTFFASANEAQVADMETEPVANKVAERQVPFLAVRVISDEYFQILPVAALNAGFDARTCTPTPLKLLTHLASHPGDIGPFIHFVKGLNLARRNLTNFVLQLNKELPGHW